MREDGFLFGLNNFVGADQCATDPRTCFYHKDPRIRQELDLLHGIALEMIKEGSDDIAEIRVGLLENRRVESIGRGEPKCLSRPWRPALLFTTIASMETSRRGLTNQWSVHTVELSMHILVETLPDPIFRWSVLFYPYAGPDFYLSNIGGEESFFASHIEDWGQNFCEPDTIALATCRYVFEGGYQNKDSLSLHNLLKINIQRVSDSDLDSVAGMMEEHMQELLDGYYNEEPYLENYDLGDAHALLHKELMSHLPEGTELFDKGMLTFGCKSIKGVRIGLKASLDFEETVTLTVRVALPDGQSLDIHAIKAHCSDEEREVHHYEGLEYYWQHPYSLEGAEVISMVGREACLTAARHVNQWASAGVGNARIRTMLSDPITRAEIIEALQDAKIELPDLWPVRHWRWHSYCDALTKAVADTHRDDLVAQLRR